MEGVRGCAVAAGLAQLANQTVNHTRVVLLRHYLGTPKIINIIFLKMEQFGCTVQYCI